MSRATADVERARAILDHLIRQRQDLRSAPVDEGLLEANRLGIVYWQRQLARVSGTASEKPAAA
jgi:hypothetical protein